MAKTDKQQPEKHPRHGALDLSIVSSTGLRQTSGYIMEEWHRKLQGQQGIAAYTEMRDNDPTIGASFHAITSLMRQVPRRVVPADENNPDAVKWAEFVAGALDDMSMTVADFVSERMSMLWAGYAPFEIIYKIRRGPDRKDPRFRSKFDDGLIGWRKFQLIKQETVERWNIDKKDGSIDGLFQNAIYTDGGGHGVHVPIEKMLLFRTSTYANNPEGRSLLRNAYISYDYRKRFQQIQAIGAARDLVGYPIMEVPPGLLHPDASAEDKQVLKNFQDIITQIHRDEREGAVIPSELDTEGNPTGYKLRPFKSGGSKAFNLEPTIVRLGKEIARVMLADLLFFGEGKVGSFALVDSRTSLLATSLGAFMDMNDAIFNSWGIGRLMKLNRVPQDLWPTHKHGDIEKRDLEALGKFLTSAAAGEWIKPNDEIEQELLTAASLPTRAEGPDEETRGGEIDGKKPANGDARPKEAKS